MQWFFCICLYLPLLFFKNKQITLKIIIFLLEKSPAALNTLNCQIKNIQIHMFVHKTHKNNIQKPYVFVTIGKQV